MAVNYASKYSESLSEFYSLKSGPKVHKSSPWERIMYTSMTGWMFLNYTLLALMMAVPMGIVYGLWSIFN